MPSHSPSSGDQFATTHWSLVLAAGERGNTESRRALERLCRTYWPPLYLYARRRVQGADEAQDLTQAFFERLLDKRYLDEANPERGRFRAFLITAFKHFLSKEWDKARAVKRGGRDTTIPLDFSQHDITDELAEELTPERHYERQWALTLLTRVMQRLQREMERSGKGAQFQHLKDFIGGTAEATYSTCAQELGMTESAARMAASRLRARYRELLHDEIAQTVASDEEIDDEVRYLFQALGN